MSTPNTPTNFYLQTGQATNFLSWDQTTTGATSFIVQRSLDNVTFTTLATLSGTPLANFYLDSAVTAGTQYWYQVAAANGSGTSLYCASQGIVPATIGQVSLQWIRLMSQLRADLFNSQFISVPEWNSYISNSYKELYDLLIQKFGDDYFSSSTYTITTNGSDELYPLPNDFYKSTLVEVSLNTSDPNSWVTLRRYMRVQQNLWNYPNVYTFYGITNVRYRFTGNFIQLVPIAQANQTVRIWYSPRPQILFADTATLDGISGWEDYVIIDAARKALLKQESDTAALMEEKLAMKQRIEEAAENRDVGDPETISDSRVRNFAWSDTDGYGSGGSMGF